MHSLQTENILSETEQEYGLAAQPVFKVNDKVRIIYQKGLFNHPLKALNILFNLQKKKKKKQPRQRKKYVVYWLRRDWLWTGLLDTL